MGLAGGALPGDDASQLRAAIRRETPKPAAAPAPGRDNALGDLALIVVGHQMVKPHLDFCVLPRHNKWLPRIHSRPPVWWADLALAFGTPLP